MTVRSEMQRRMWSRCGGILLATLTFLAPSLTFAYEIVHFDLGQDGAAALIIGDGAGGQPFYVLIDTGRASNVSGRGAAVVREELARRGIGRVDLVILTHLDADHAEGLFTLYGVRRTPTRSSARAEEKDIRGPPIEIERVLFPLDVRPQHLKINEELRFAAAANGSQILSPTADIIEELYSSYGVTVIALPARPKARPNETSLVIVGHDRALDRAFLFTGDIPQHLLPQILPRLPRKVSVLQAPHHGADSGVLQLVARTNPDYIVISANRQNRFHHPKLEVLRRLAIPRAPPERRGRVLPWSVHRTSRFYAQELADDVRTVIATSRHKLWRPVGQYLRPPGNDLDRPRTLDLTSDLYPTNPAIGAVAAAPSISAEQVLLTGQHGHLTFVDGRFTGSTTEIEAEFNAAVWKELARLSDAELTVLRDWDDAQAYLSLVVAETRQPFERSRQLNLASFIAGASLAESTRWVGNAELVNVGRQRVTAGRWKELQQLCSTQRAMEREAALQQLIEALTGDGMSQEEVTSLVLAALRDQSEGAERHVAAMVDTINGRRRAEFSAALESYRFPVSSVFTPKPIGWLRESLLKLGVPEPLATGLATAPKRLPRRP